MEATRHALYVAFICALVFIVGAGLYYQFSVSQ